MSHLEDLKRRALAQVDARRDELIRIADTIHANPEVAFEEHQSAALLCRVLEENGFTVARGVANLETAFVAGLPNRGRPTVAFLAEYDALPGLGHACGHNLIGTSAVGAALAVKAVLAELPGAVQVIGTPAEEGGGGKVIMVDAGVFEGVDAALIVHPSSKNKTRGSSLTSYKIRVEFFGKPAHAAAKPDEGINALDAIILTFNGINALRQHLRDDARIHGIITHGGDAPNIVPEYAAARFYVRAVDVPYTEEMIQKVRGCAEGAALMTGARLEFEEYAPHYENMLSNPVLAHLFEANMAALGIALSPPEDKERMGSTDMGNVTQVVPGLHPSIVIGPEEMGGHTAEFCEAAGSPAGHEGMIQAAKLMAMTAVDLLAQPDNLVAVRQAFEEQKRQQGG
ncbi:MAG: M20 family metallopeptidase [Chloroflexota bacterium]